MLIFYLTGFGTKSPSNPDNTNGNGSDGNYQVPTSHVDVRIKDNTLWVNEQQTTLGNLLQAVNSTNQTLVHLIDNGAYNSIYVDAYNLLQGNNYNILEKVVR